MRRWRALHTAKPEALRHGDCTVNSTSRTVSSWYEVEVLHTREPAPARGCRLLALLPWARRASWCPTCLEEGDLRQIRKPVSLSMVVAALTPADYRVRFAYSGYNGDNPESTTQSKRLGPPQAVAATSAFPLRPRQPAVDSSGQVASGISQHCRGPPGDRS